MHSTHRMEGTIGTRKNEAGREKYWDRSGIYPGDLCLFVALLPSEAECDRNGLRRMVWCEHVMIADLQKKLLVRAERQAGTHIESSFICTWGFKRCRIEFRSPVVDAEAARRVYAVAFPFFKLITWI